MEHPPTASAQQPKQEVFRLKSGDFTTSEQSWTAFTGCTGRVKLVGVPIQYILSLGGHYVDGAGAFANFRLKLTPANPSPHEPYPTYYLPNEEGVRKYIYVDHCRLEEFTMVGVSAVPSGEFNITLEVKQQGNGGTATYKWSSAYGHIVLVIS